MILPPTVNQLESTEGFSLHLGCGHVNIEVWIKIDARNFNHVHLATTNFELNQFAEQSISRIYICHVLEHFADSDVNHLLNIFSQKLMPGGKFYISLPDFSLISKNYMHHQNLDMIRGAFLGGQDYEYKVHKSIFDYYFMTNKLKKFGFLPISSWRPNETFDSELRDFSSHEFSSYICATNQ